MSVGGVGVESPVIARSPVPCTPSCPKKPLNTLTWYGSTSFYDYVLGFSRARREQRPKQATSKRAPVINDLISSTQHAPGTSHRHPRSSPSQSRTTGPVSVSPMPAVCHLTPRPRRIGLVASASHRLDPRMQHAARTQKRLKAREPRRKHCGGQRQTTGHTAADGAGRDSRRTHA